VGEAAFADAFSAADQPTRAERRYGLRRSSAARWHEFDERFDAVRHPNEAHRFGWVCEFDPTDPRSTPVKRTALGRAGHAAIQVGTTADGRARVYLADGDAFEYLYKYTSRDPIRPAAHGLSAAQANAGLLDNGTLWVARFDADGSGRWLALQHGGGPLTAAGGFADAGDTLVKTRQAADALGATRLDGAQALALDAASGWVYAALAHKALRSAPGQADPDAAKLRADKAQGQVLRWREEGDLAGERFRWKLLLQAGNPQAPRAEERGAGLDDAFIDPSTLALDARGRLWLGAGMAATARGQDNGQLLSCNPVNGEVRRFLSGPVNCAIGGLAFTPDGSTLFANISHPGEAPGERSDPAAPRRHSNWPDFQADGRPRSATLAVRRSDGGVIGG
jgi:secreted PhoX family phosphatase